MGGLGLYLSLGRGPEIVWGIVRETFDAHQEIVVLVCGGFYLCSYQGFM